MLRRKLRESLTVRIFLTTLVILLAASASTFGLIAWATPITYTQVISEALEEEAKALAMQLDGKTYDKALGLAQRFSGQMHAEVMLAGPDSSLLIGVTDTQLQSDEIQMQIHLAQESGRTYKVYGNAEGWGAAFAYGTAQGEAAAAPGALQEGTAPASQTDTAEESADAAPQAEAVDEAVVVADAAASSVTIATQSGMLYAGSFQISDRVGDYQLLVAPSVQPMNQAVEALRKVAPWLLCAMLLFSSLCAFVYSRFITRPILRLSDISQKMAQLDFGWQCAEERSDEIGILGRNLNGLSQRLSGALDELRGANAVLQQDIERERELERQRLAFFSAVSHELKTPVTILKGQITGMLEGVDVYRDRDKYLSRALQVTGRMEHLVQEILTVSRMESSDFCVRNEPLELTRLLREQLALYAEWMEQKELRLETELPPTVEVPGDEKLLCKALGNILSNAVLYSPPGEAVRVAVRQEEGQTVLTVENSGIQIPQEAFAHLFEAFYRVEQSRNRSTGGSGLGLYLTGLILERHGAAYNIENTGGGVRFTVRFFVNKGLD